jgi:cell division protein FtsB
MTEAELPAPARKAAGPRPRPRLPATRGGLVWLGVLVVVGAFLALQVGRQVYTNWQITQQAEQIRREIAEAETRNAELRDELTYLSSSAYVSQEARRLTNLGAAGEQVLIIPPGSETAPPPQYRDNTAQQPLIEQWLDLFFGAPTS